VKNLQLILPEERLYPEHMVERGPRPAPEPQQGLPDQMTPVADDELFDSLMQEAEQLSPDELARSNQAADELQLSLDIEGRQPPTKAGLSPSEPHQDMPPAATSPQPPLRDKA